MVNEAELLTWYLPDQSREKVDVDEDAQDDGILDMVRRLQGAQAPFPSSP